MKRVVLGLVVVLALGLAMPSHAQMVAGSCTPCAPYNVTVSYEPIQPQPGEYTFCTTLPYGCPDGAAMAQPCGVGCAPCAPMGACAPCAPMMGACAPLCNPMGLVCAPLNCLAPAVNGVMGTAGCLVNFAFSTVAGVLNCVTGMFCCAPACGPFCAPACAPCAPMCCPQ